MCAREERYSRDNEAVHASFRAATFQHRGCILIDAGSSRLRSRTSESDLRAPRTSVIVVARDPGGAVHYVNKRSPHIGVGAAAMRGDIARVAR